MKVYVRLLTGERHLAQRVVYEGGGYWRLYFSEHRFVRVHGERIEARTYTEFVAGLVRAA